MLIASDQGYRPATELDILTECLDFRDARVLELGCGRARWTRTLAERFPVRQIIATEVDRIQHAKNLQITDLPDVTFKDWGAENIKLPDGSIDIVIMLKSLHHVPIPLMEKALKEIHRVLEPGGMAYISEPVYAGEFNEILRMFNDEREVRQAAFDTLTRSVKSGGFELVKQVFFESESRFSDFAEFEQRILRPTHSDHQVSDELAQQVRQAFEQHLGPEGARFINPHRVDLLRKC